MNCMNDFPEKLSSLFRETSCLKVNEEEGTWLCEEISGKKRVIVKVAFTDEAAFLQKNERDILTRIHQSSAAMAAYFPAVLAAGKAGSFSWLSRTWIPGMSLADYVETQECRAGFPRTKALRILLCVLEQLRFLHRMDPPVIHRDIKPQNIIIDANGGQMRVCLIDFGIARLFRKTLEEASGKPDTVAMGTFYFAPPEQFGYRQTDARSDLYAAGILLRYCLTLDYGEDADRMIDQDIREVIRHATRFDPENRYQNADEMIRDIQKLLPGNTSGESKKVQGKGKENRKLRAALLTLFFLLSVMAVLYFAMKRAGKVAPPLEETAARALESVWEFQEPLIEEAVREQLGLPEGDITLGQLSLITSLHIFGRQIYENEDEFIFNGEFVTPAKDEYKTDGRWLENGGIESLADLTVMSNLEEAYLYRQNISDISVLFEDMPEQAGAGKGNTRLKNRKLTRIGLGYNPVADLSILSGNLQITGLNISCLELRDLSFLSTMRGLKTLSLAGYGNISLKDIDRLPLEELNLVDTWPEDEEKLAHFSGLKKLMIGKLYPGLLQQLSALSITELSITHTSGVALDDLQILKGLRRLIYRVAAEDEPEILTQNTLSFPQLRSLDLKGLRIENFQALQGLENLEELGIYDSECPGFEGLDALPGLKTLFVNEEQKKQLEAVFPDSGWEYVE